jgi:hypothetical protein
MSELGFRKSQLEVFRIVSTLYQISTVYLQSFAVVSKEEDTDILRQFIENAAQ